MQTHDVSHKPESYSRKLTRWPEQYPSIYCNPIDHPLIRQGLDKFNDFRRVLSKLFHIKKVATESCYVHQGDAVKSGILRILEGGQVPYCLLCLHRDNSASVESPAMEWIVRAEM